MSFSSAVAVIAVIVALLSAPVSADFQGNVCGYMQGAPGNVWYPVGSNGWTTIFHAAVTYTWGNPTNTRASKPMGPFWQLTGTLNGTIAEYSPYIVGGTQAVVIGNIVALAGVGQDFASNAVYNTSTAFWPLDGNGLTFILDQAIQLPGQSPQQAIDEVNIWYQAGTSPNKYLRMENTGIIDQTQTGFLSDLPGANTLTNPLGQSFAATSSISTLEECIAAFAAKNLNIAVAVPQPTEAPAATSHWLNYTVTNHASYQLTVQLEVELAHGQPQFDSFGVPYWQLSSGTGTNLPGILGGTRTYGWGTPANGYSSIVVSSPIQPPSCASSNQIIYTAQSQFPYIDNQGIAYTTTNGNVFPKIGAAPGPGVSNFSSWVVTAFYQTGVVEENNVVNSQFPTLPQIVTFQ